MRWNSSGGERAAGGDARTGATPRPERPPRRIGAKLLVTAGQRVLLIRERRGDGSTFWSLPGGGIDPGESLSDGLRRELREELGCGCALGGVVAVCRYRHASRPGVETRYAVFGGRLRSPAEPNADEGVVGCAWVTRGELPPALLEPFRRVVSALLPGPDGQSPTAHAARSRTAVRD